MSSRLEQLAKLAGISSTYTDFWGLEHPVNAEQQRSLLEVMGYPAGDDAQVNASLTMLEEEPWRSPLPPVVIVRKDRQPPEIPLVVPDQDEAELAWSIVEEQGRQHGGAERLHELPALEARPLDGRRFVRRILRVAMHLPLGYHRLRVQLSTEPACHGETTLIVVPERCYLPPALERGARVWGASVQLYAVRSSRNWGIGDFADLRALVGIMADAGASFVGLNPLHALNPIYADSASPYYPSSRRFLNTIYIDVETVPDLPECEPARALLADDEFAHRLAALRSIDHVDYVAVTACKRRVLELLHASFRQRHLAGSESQRAQEFRCFQAEGGVALQRFATYQALAERQARTRSRSADWRTWSPEFRDPQSPEVERFSQEHEQRIEFFVYLQWLADRQFAAAAAEARRLGIGLYLDLAVGVDGGGADAWSERGLIVDGATVGAPPDSLNTLGQNWGVAPFHPHALRAQAYRAFAALLRANMRRSGALRIDHVMALMRLFWIPLATPASGGVYVEYSFEDLLGILALESVRQRCIVIGEDLGTVPHGLRERLRDVRALGCRLLMFEFDAAGIPHAPETYPEQALVSTSTHDLPSLPAFWRGLDVEIRDRLGFYASPVEREVASRERDRVRHRLAEVLGAGAGEAPVLLSYEYLASTPSLLLSVRLEDVLEQLEPTNVPGTGMEFPNWRAKLPVAVENLARDARLTALAASLRRSRALPAPQTVPLSTYRLQFHRGFTFRDARELVPYLAALGIEHLYVSPLFKARSGSTHGYDIIDHRAFNPEIGGREAFDTLVTALHLHSMGAILDLVPNHMGIGGAENAWWLDVLKWAEASPYAAYFDIDWHPPLRELDGKVVLPVLGDHYGAVLEHGRIRLCYNAASGSFHARYYEHLFPIAPQDYAPVLRLAVRLLREEPKASGGSLEALRALAASFNVLRRSDSHREQLLERRRHGAELEQRLRSLCELPAVRACVEGAVESYNVLAPHPGAGRLHRLLQRQAYRIAYWRVAHDEINYRRFFDINHLAGLRMEDPECFAVTHELAFQLIAEGRLQGLRIDHIDGLFDPAAYCRILRARAELLGQPLYLVVEKITARHEQLREDWQADGTTGYDFTNVVNGLFVDAANASRFDRIYRRFTGLRLDFDQVLYACKQLQVRVNLSSELFVLANELAQIARIDPRSTDYTRNGLREALAEIVSFFPVYRTYVSGEAITAEDRRYIDWAVAQAKKHSSLEDKGVFDFVHGVLTTDSAREPGSRLSLQAVVHFVMKFQQYTAPVMAKALEDTALYRYVRLLSLNEVGGDPRRFGVSVAAFHRANQERRSRLPHAMVSTATHDSKRGEDARARIDALSEMPDRWAATLARWSRFNRRKKHEVDGRLAPDRNDEYLIYQTLLGSWPNELDDEQAMDEALLSSYRERIEGYIIKAMREAKRHSSWTSPNDAYEEAALQFVRRLLDTSRHSLFLPSFLAFQRSLAHIGAFTSLSQTLLKLTVPGVPDIYQGCELWDLSLVDPDNRRPVDYRTRAAALRELDDAAEAGELALVRGILQEWRDGRVKLYVTSRVLRLRAAMREVFLAGGYTPLEITGERADHLCAFMREQVIVVGPRLFSALTEGGARMPLGHPAWGETSCALPRECAGRCYRNVFTGQALSPALSSDGTCALPMAQVLAEFPVALLVPTSE